MSVSCWYTLTSSDWHEVCVWNADNGSVIDSEECEEAYGDLLSLYEAKQQHNSGAATLCDTFMCVQTRKLTAFFVQKI